MPLKLTDIQDKALALLTGAATFILLFGGSRSGKTFLLVLCVVLRAIKEPDSRHAIFRQTRKDLKESIWLDTFPKVLKLCFPGVTPRKNEQELYVKFSNGSEIWFGYLADKKHADNVLGKEYNTIYFNEVSEIPYAMFNKALTRLALKNGLENKVYLDCNPPGRWHWAYKLFIQRIMPGKNKEKIKAPEKYVSMLMNPEDNAENLSGGYLDILDSLPEEERLRFKEGIWAEGISGGIYTREIGLAEREGRIGKFGFDEKYPIFTFWDLGIGDHTAIWLVQFRGDKIFLIDFYQNTNEGMEHYAEVLKNKAEQRGYEYKTAYIPHDGANREWSTGRSRREAMEKAGFEVEVLPRLGLEDGINGARMLFGKCHFDEEKCEDGLEALRNYRREFMPEKNITKQAPVHDWASHPADAFRYMAMGYDFRLAGKKKSGEDKKIKEEGITFGELLAQRKRGQNYGINY